MPATIPLNVTIAGVTLADAARIKVLRHINGCIAEGIEDPKVVYATLEPAMDVRLPADVFDLFWRRALPSDEVDKTQPAEAAPIATNSAKEVLMTATQEMVTPASSSPNSDTAEAATASPAPDAPAEKPKPKRRRGRPRASEKSATTKSDPVSEILYKVAGAEFRAEEDPKGKWSVTLSAGTCTPEFARAVARLFREQHLEDVL